MTTANNKDTVQSVNTLLVVLLIIAAFLIGSLWTNVEYLKKGVATGSTNTNQVAPNAAVPNPVVTGSVAKAAVSAPKLTKDDHIRGNKNAQIAVFEYADLECPFCKRFHPTMQQIIDTYKDKVMWVYRHFPLSFHANAQKEAEASECANEQGGNDTFWKYVDKIYEKTTSNGTGFALDQLVPLAKELGLDEVKFKDCLDKGKYAKLVSDQELQGQNEGVTGTPGNIVVNISTGKTQIIPGAVPFDQVKAIIDQML
ncbi:DsbA family protein [Candidatus Gottesmanbacteria bacterium]|nr:DsbA family protein [Candidatus Gottesmanbacteria bacterium]